MNTLVFIITASFCTTAHLFAMEQKQITLNTTLGIAAQQGLTDEVLKAIECGADPVEPCIPGGATPLQKAAYYGHLETVKVLVEHDADINRIEPPYNMSPFHAAIRQGHQNIVQYFLHSGAHLTIVTQTGETPYQLARKMAKFEICDDLNQFSRLAEKKSSSLVQSAQINYYAQVATLLKQNNTLIDEQDSEGNSALIWAAKNSNYPLTKFLLKNNAQPDIQNYAGESAITIALEKSDIKLVNLLMY